MIILKKSLNQTINKGAEWGAPFEKREEKQINKVVNGLATENILMNIDDIDKDLNKNTNLIEENKKVFEQIAKITDELKNLKQETSLLYDRLNKRQDYLIERVRASISDKIKELLPEYPNHVVYDEDELKTGSSPSSLDQDDEDQNEIQQE